MTAVDLNRRIDAISAKPASWRCPYCGRVHRKVRFRLYATALWLLATVIWLLAPGTRTSASTTPRQIAPRLISVASLPLQTPTATALPIPTETPAAPSSPTPLPIPKTGVVWAETSAGAYLYAEPGLEIVTAIPNGEFVQLLDEFAAYGSLAWTLIIHEGQTGWMDATKVNRVRFEGETFYLVASEAGALLYTAPQGQQVAWLPEGTPLRFNQASQGWSEVSTLGGQTGWVVSELISPPDEDSD